MTVVTIKGVPKSIKVVRFSFFLRKNILRNKKAQILVTRTSSDFHVLFKSEEDAHIVNNTLQHFEFKHKDGTHTLEAYINNDPSILNLEAFTKTDNNFDDRKRSASPKYGHNESCDNIEEVNKAIELTRRKRILLEEERKLLLEQKKLSLIKALNPTSIKELENLDKICDHASSDTIENMLAKAKKEPHIGKNKERTTQGLKIYRIRQKIFHQMIKIFNSHVSSKNRYAMKKNVFTILTSRIQSLLENKPDITKPELFCLYRKTYPLKDDSDFILDIVKHANEMKNGDESNNTQTVSNVSENRSISELSEFQFDMENDLDDWMDDDSSKVGHRKPLRPQNKNEQKKEPDVQSVPQEQA